MRPNLSESPRVVARRCGGWLAVSPPSFSLKIAVAGTTEGEVRDRFRAAVSGWERNLKRATDQLPAG